MNPRVLSFIVAAIAYGVTLTIADLILDNMRVPWWAGLIAWALFTLSITLLRPVLTRTLSGSVHGYTWVIGLITVLLSLIITTVLTPMTIRGVWTWVWATLINAASNCEGGSQTPASIMAPWKRPNFAVSQVAAPSVMPSL